MPRRLLPDHLRCRYTTKAGRRCRSARMEGHDLCPICWRRAQKKRPATPLHPDLVADVLLPPGESLSTARAVNQALTRLFRLVAQRRIPTRDAQILAYLGQLAVSTLLPLQKEKIPEPGHPILGDNPDAAITSLARSFQSVFTAAEPSAPASADSLSALSPAHPEAEP